MTAAAATRLRAARALLEVVDQGASLSAALPRALRDLDPQERGFVHELVYGSLREYPRLHALLQALLRQPLKPRDRDIECLMVIGLYQLRSLQVKAHGAVHATVDAARLARKAWAAKLINGVLRNYQRRAEALEEQVAAQPAARYAHPAWLLERLQQDWPEDWEAIVAGNNQKPPLCLRVNLRKGSREDYLQALREADIEAEPLEPGPAAVRVRSQVNVESLPGYAEGRFSVQDSAAQLAAPLLDARPGMRVLDACAAPGGKTAHILELQPGLEELVAVDIDAERLRRVGENLARLGLQARLVVGDAAASTDWAAGGHFDRILLDAPCSATGVIRRHPDIKLHRQAQDIERLAALQASMLDNLWPLLKPGGILLYVTCSVMHSENCRQIEAFLARRPDAAPLAIAADWGRASGSGRQLLPIVTAATEPAPDGFYYARLKRMPETQS